MSRHLHISIWIVILFLTLIVQRVQAQYQINGVANQISCNCYQLTPDAPFSGGSVWNVNQINLTSQFNFNFEVFLGCSNGGADGIAFVLQPVNVTQGGGSSSLGYGGITPSLAIEIDTWMNDVTMSDPPQDHIAIMSNGNSNHASANNLAGPVIASSTQNNIEDCGWHTIQVLWDPGLNTLAVFFDGVFRTSYTGNIINTIFGGNPLVYWGWTGGTGSISADQRFCNSILPIYNVAATTHCVGDPVQFTNASLTSSGNISNFSWNFGDGGTGSGAPVNHTYNTAGTFDVTMTITTEGCTEDTVIPITISPNPVVNLGADLNICTGQSVQLNNPNSLGAGTYTWSPGTALTSISVASPTSSATASTNYALTFTNASGCSGSDVVQVIVNPLPTANAGLDLTMCEGEQIGLQASGGTSYFWTPAAPLNNASIANPNASPVVTTVFTVTATDANNCSDTDDMTITVVPAPALNAGADQNICEGDQVQLNAIGTGSFVWSPPTALSSTVISNPTATPVITTTYRVTLTDANNCTATDSVIIDVDPIPVASFPDPVAVCDGNSVQFSNNSTGSITTYAWDFGDGTVGSGPNPTHIYPSIGVYNVSLVTTSSNGCFDSTTGTAEVIVGPIPVFTIANGPDVCQGEAMQIVNNSNGPIVSYLWNFGNGNTSTAMDPTYAYPGYGSYTVTLTVGTADLCYNSLPMDVVVHPVPVTSFGASLACFGDLTAFNDLTTIPIGTVTGWEWLFGDASNIDYTQDPEHTYTSAGAFSVRLIAQSAMGCRDTSIRTIYVNPTPLVAIASGDVCLGDATSFTNSTVPNDNTIASWNWTFGDGQVANAFEPGHVYSTFGNFNVQLTATSDSGCVGVSSTSLDVYPYPSVAFGFSDVEGCAPMNIEFINQTSINSNYSIASYEWIFGDGTGINLSNPEHIYNSPGIYDVSLIATTAGGGCTDTLILSQALTIYITPTADFDYRPGDPSMLDPKIRFNNTSVNGVTYSWDFGDGGVSSLVEPEHTYLAEGDYLVTLTAMNGICASSITQTIQIDPETFIYIPNSFTPNNDRINDQFIAQGIGIEKFTMAIFDRWGTELFYTADILDAWDGRYKGKESPIGTYVYIIEIVNVKGEPKRFTGSVNLFK
jgi:gliding motility-associated-like protein